jgi:hypothetical protein
VTTLSAYPIDPSGTVAAVERGLKLAFIEAIVSGVIGIRSARE